jgi:hypothetical protein
MGRGAKYYQKYREERKAAQKVWYLAHRESEREKARQRLKAWKERDPEGLKLYQKSVYFRNRKRCIETAGRHYRALRVEFFKYYGDHCICCGELEKKFLTIEHLRGDGAKHRKAIGSGAGTLIDLKKRGWPRDGYAVLCFNCNSGKYLNGGICPHVTQAAELFIGKTLAVLKEAKP